MLYRLYLEFFKNYSPPLVVHKLKFLEPILKLDTNCTSNIGKSKVEDSKKSHNKIKKKMLKNVRHNM